MNELPEQLRAFIAIRLPGQSAAALTELQSQLRQVFRNVTWTRPDAMHVTLRFLGDIASARLDELVAGLGAAVAVCAPFQLRLTGPGTFSGRVLWVGLTGGLEPLQSLAAATHHASRDLTGHEEERAFHPHVTLGRLRKPWRGTGAALAKITPPHFEPWQVDHVELIRSELMPQGSRYTVLAALPLRAPPAAN